jgi:hypothetical protein
MTATAWPKIATDQIQIVDWIYPSVPFTPATETACKVKGCRCRKFEDGQMISGFLHCIGDCNHTVQMHGKPKPKTAASASKPKRGRRS